MKYNTKGFTLIEMMIVIAIISILSTMAIPSYQDRVIRTQVEEGLVLARFVQEGVEAFYKQNGRMPMNNREAGLPAADKIIGNYVSEINVKSGRINIQLGNRINKHAESKILSIRPALVKGEPKVPITWIYGYATIPKGMSVNVENESTILARYLPVRCRY